jgi:hypothetical protein
LSARDDKNIRFPEEPTVAVDNITRGRADGLDKLGTSIRNDDFRDNESIRKCGTPNANKAKEENPQGKEEWPSSCENIRRRLSTLPMR